MKKETMTVKTVAEKAAKLARRAGLQIDIVRSRSGLAIRLGDVVKRETISKEDKKVLQDNGCLTAFQWNPLGIFVTYSHVDIWISAGIAEMTPDAVDACLRELQEKLAVLPLERAHARAVRGWCRAMKRAYGSRPQSFVMRVLQKVRTHSAARVAAGEPTLKIA